MAKGKGNITTNFKFNSVFTFIVLRGFQFGIQKNFRQISEELIDDFCHCAKPTVRKTSWVDGNAGWRYSACEKYRMLGGCTYHNLECGSRELEKNSLESWVDLMLHYDREKLCSFWVNSSSCPTQLGVPIEP
ncbi:mannose-binding lectin superfamily protein [Striga asiatica]|uniref:Mannose-binding lectin superfamily protein n=1 Tax=Striga asiatica TaxID=4170 RepID=A0A5A7P467_STRAF|nr:mannose-binding lectin superfamily protein [Striga asiatica]